MLIYKNYDESTLQLDNILKYSFFILNFILGISILYILIQEVIFELTIFFFIYSILFGYYIYKKTLSVEYFELHEEYVLTKGLFDHKWKKTPIQEITYDYNYKKDVEYLTIHLGDQLFEFEASSNLTISAFLNQNVKKISFINDLGNINSIIFYVLHLYY